MALALADAPARYRGSWNFGPDENAVRTVKDLAEHVVKTWGSGSIECRPDPKGPHEATLLQLSSAKARDALGWRPLWAFDRAASETTGWYRQVRDGADALNVTRAQIATYMKELSA